MRSSSWNGEVWDTIRADYGGLVKFYSNVKQLVVTAEKWDLDQRVPLSAISELRSVLDHIMRADQVLLGLRTQDNIRQQHGVTAAEYCTKNINKALGHLYRAGYDAYDVISMRLIDEIDRALRSVEIPALYAVVPSAAVDIERPFESAKRLAVEAKLLKDIESPSDAEEEEPCAEQERECFRLYEKANMDLLDIRDRLLENMPQLVSYDQDQRKHRSRNYLFAICLTAVSLAVGFLGRGCLDGAGKATSPVHTPSGTSQEGSVPVGPGTGLDGTRR